ncbi:MAG TPA: LacI family DNA-binding transcriptional regulator [Vicinamibacterales bacterium]|nr:LacI family DNA-binding transcriptional regulator [Vicinamibacterales bacterium]
MKDIAHRAGVSQATVSHVLRGRHGDFRISEGTAGRVLQMAAQLGYRPSALARNFKSHRAFSLCLAVGDLTDSFWSGVATGAQEEAERHGYTLVVSNTGEIEEKERHAIDLLRERRVDGIILCPTQRKPAHFKELRASGLPFVFVDRTADGFDVSSVVTDNVAGMRMAVDHLVGRGHRRIGYVGGPTDRSTFRDRLKGYRQGLAAHRLRPGPYAIAPSEPEAARQAAMRVLGASPSVTAVIGANFWLTVGTLRAAPDDVVVVGFDDLVLTDLLRRPVTTIVQPVADLGRHAVQLLIDDIAHPGRPRHLVLPPKLVVRGGVGD